MHPTSLAPVQVPPPSGPPPGYDPSSVQMIQHYPYIHRQPPRPPSVASSIHGGPVQETGPISQIGTTRRDSVGTRRGSVDHERALDMSYADNPPVEDPPLEVQALLFPTRSLGSERAAGTVRRREDRHQEISSSSSSGEDQEIGRCPATPPGVPVPLAPLTPVSVSGERRTSVSSIQRSIGLGPRGGDNSQFR